MVQYTKLNIMYIVLCVIGKGRSAFAFNSRSEAADYIEECVSIAGGKIKNLTKRISGYDLTLANGVDGYIEIMPVEEKEVAYEVVCNGCRRRFRDRENAVSWIHNQGSAWESKGYCGEWKLEEGARYVLELVILKQKYAEGDYSLLGVSPSDTVDAVKKAYRRRAKECHPDCGGNKKDFIALKGAYDRIIAGSAKGGKLVAHRISSYRSFDARTFFERYYTGTREEDSRIKNNAKKGIRAGRLAFTVGLFEMVLVGLLGEFWQRYQQDRDHSIMESVFLIAIIIVCLNGFRRMQRGYNAIVRSKKQILDC